MPSNRQLAAIMFTDIVGYTAIMGKDIHKALDLVRQSKDIQKPFVEKYNGVWLKEMGDGAMAQFSTALDAVHCAIEIQRLARVDFDGNIRIGIHLGDITMEDNDVYGDGVNVAARLESVADPGGIYVSESVEKAIRGQSTIKTKYLGECQLKNVDYGVRTYAIQGQGLPVPTTGKIRALSDSKTRKRKVLVSTLVYTIIFSVLILSGWWIRNEFFSLQTKKIESLAVLPIDNFSGDQEQESLASGLHDNLITTLSRISSLRVIGKTSTQQNKIKGKSMTEIADELGVDALIEASILTFGDTIRINVQLIGSFPNEEHLWAKIFDRPTSNILSLFNDVTQAIAEEINLTLTNREKALLSDAKEVDPKAYKAYLTGQFYWDKLTPKDLNIALDYYKLAIEIDSSFISPYLGVAGVWGGRRQMNVVPHQQALDEATKAIAAARAIDSLDVELLTYSTSWMTWDWPQREEDFLNRLALNPSSANTHAFYANYLVIFKRNNEADYHMQKALELDPLNGLIQGLNAMNLMVMRKCGVLISLDNETEQTHPLSRNALRACYAMEGMYEQAFAAEIQWAVRRKNDQEMVEILQQGYEVGGYLEAIRQQAALVERRSEVSFVPTMFIANRYAILENKEKTLEYLEKGLVEHDANLPYVAVIPLFDFLHDEPRFKAIIAEMNLPE